nr:MAG TPA: hypothetical protein [Caudoviricetes sp.]
MWYGLYLLQIINSSSILEALKLSKSNIFKEIFYENIF